MVKSKDDDWVDLSVSLLNLSRPIYDFFSMTVVIVVIFLTVPQTPAIGLVTSSSSLPKRVVTHTGSYLSSFCSRIVIVRMICISQC